MENAGGAENGDQSSDERTGLGEFCQKQNITKNKNFVGRQGLQKTFGGGAIYWKNNGGSKAQLFLCATKAMERP